MMSCLDCADDDDDDDDFLSAEELQRSSFSRWASPCRPSASTQRKPEHGQSEHGASAPPKQGRQSTPRRQSTACGKRLAAHRSLFRNKHGA